LLKSLSLDKQWFLNAALFIPAGLVLTWTFGKTTRVIVALLALSMSIEFFQRVFYLGAADPADIVANSIGAIIGAACSIPIKRASGR
jgi:glycopeptide antibiotics resistance protein